jgi:hypothetical protein
MYLQVYALLLACSIVGRGIMLQAGRSRVHSCTMALGLTQPLTEMSTRRHL